MGRPTLTIVGVGPGDPELLTVKGVRALREADLVFLPKAEDGSESLAGRAVRGWIGAGHQRISELRFPLAGLDDSVKMAWVAHAATVESALFDAGPETRGVYPLLGDPMLFGSAVYLIDALRRRGSRIDVAVIPGVTSFATAAAAALAPLAIGDESLVVVSGRIAAKRLPMLLRRFETVVVLKLGRWVPEVKEAVRSAGASMVYAERLGMPGEHLVRDFNSLPEPAPYFSLLIVRRSSGGSSAQGELLWDA
jgi:precorrin-2/cobalt-factor-2 C20-methyltransferase